MQSAKIAMFLSLAVATAAGIWYLRVRIPDKEWRRSHEAGQHSMSQGRFGEAERQFATAVATAQTLGADDRRLALSLAHQAEALVAQARFDDAIPLLERALQIHQKLVGPDHRDLARVLEQYAVPLRETGRTAQAEAAESRARTIHARSARGGKSGTPGR